MERTPRWPMPARRALSAPALTLALGVVTLLSMGPLMAVDQALNRPWAGEMPSIRDAVLVVAALGQRSVCLPLLLLVAVYFARRRRTWEPLVLSAGAVLALNLLVGLLKLLTGRDMPLRGDPSFFNDGVLFPSGHTANVVLVYGLAAYLVHRYGGLGRRAGWALGGGVAVLSVVMVGIGIYTRFHWLTDLVAGLIAGGLVLRLTVDVHRALGARRRVTSTTTERTAVPSAAEEVVVAGQVFVHIGLPKTGTSSIQQTLWRSRDRLAAGGVLVPGDTHRFQRFAFWDLLGRRLRGVDQPKVPGSWQALVESVRGWTGARVVLSDEFLVNARPAHVRRMVRAFAPAEVHVVVTVRDLGRVICSVWQQEISKGRTWPWAEFVAAVRDPEHGPATAGVGFWLRQDLRKVLSVWQTAVPPERIHVVVVPAGGSPPGLLLDLFARAVRLDPAALAPADKEVNTSVGVAETELLRRLNLSLGGRLNERQYLHLMRHAVKPALRRRTGNARLVLPAVDRDWVAERSQELVELLKSAPYDVVGDLDDLLPPQAAATAGDPGQATNEDVADAAVAALAATLEDYAGYWWRTRSQDRSSKARGGARLTSAARALGFRARLRGLEAADRNGLLARAARLYLRRMMGAKPR